MTSRENLDDFSSLVKIHLGSVIRYVKFLLRESEEAKDIAQEVFLKAWQQFDPQRRSSFRNWILKITRNLVIDRHRRRKPMVSYSGIQMENAVSPAANPGSGIAPESDFCPEGLPAYAKLPVYMREIVFMRFVERISYEEMSKITGKSEEALRKIISRAVSTIRKEVADGTMQQGE